MQLRVHRVFYLQRLRAQESRGAQKSSRVFGVRVARKAQRTLARVPKEAVTGWNVAMPGWGSGQTAADCSSHTDRCACADPSVQSAVGTELRVPPAGTARKNSSSEFIHSGESGLSALCGIFRKEPHVTGSVGRLQTPLCDTVGVSNTRLWVRFSTC